MRSSLSKPNPEESAAARRIEDQLAKLERDSKRLPKTVDVSVNGVTASLVIDMADIPNGRRVAVMPADSASATFNVRGWGYQDGGQLRLDLVASAYMTGVVKLLLVEF